MSPPVLYLLTLLGAVGLFLLLRAQRGGKADLTLRGVGALMGLGAAGLLTMGVSRALAEGGGGGPGLFAMLFGLIAVVSAAQMILTSKPVYSALHFVLVVIASAGMFLLLEAEFMAFALIIVYAGAILITYMFVLMLAQQSPDPDDPDGQAAYDVLAREPAAGALVGFVLLALLARTTLDGVPAAAPRVTAAEAMVESWERLEGMPGRLEEALPEGAVLVLDEAGRPQVSPSADGASATVLIQLPEQTLPGSLELSEAIRPENVQWVGLDLITRFPVSLEVAGIILLMAMFGAVILARRQIELTEDEMRAAVGLRRLADYDDRDEAATAGAGGGAGA